MSMLEPCIRSFTLLWRRKRTKSKSPFTRCELCAFHAHRFRVTVEWHNSNLPKRYVNDKRLAIASTFVHASLPIVKHWPIPCSAANYNVAEQRPSRRRNIFHNLLAMSIGPWAFWQTILWIDPTIVKNSSRATWIRWDVEQIGYDVNAFIVCMLYISVDVS